MKGVMGDEPGPRVMVVDDNAQNLALVDAQLRLAGYRVTLVDNGPDALAAAAIDPPDLILLDILMPGMDGYEVCRRLKRDAATRATPVAMVSSLRDRVDKIRALEEGADDFLPKPVEQAELLARVGSLLRIKRLYDELQEANTGLRQLTAELEERVAQRTAELQTKSEEVRVMSQQLWQAAKLATMGELAASIAHELNNPMATVSLRIESLLAQVPEGDPKRRPLEIVEEEVDRMTRLVANLLQFSRRAHTQISSIDVRQEIDGALELIEYQLRRRGAAIVRDFAPDLPMIYADRQLLRQLFLNLLTNASDAMPRGGTLTIRASRTAVDGGAHGIRIEFSDTGVGISADDLPRLLEPFFTTKAEGQGTGLGLPICRRIVQEHHGTFDIVSQAGVGTTVLVTLPVSNDANRAEL